MQCNTTIMQVLIKHCLLLASRVHNVVFWQPYLRFLIYCSQPSYHVPKVINPSEDIICPDALASTAIGAASIKHQVVDDLLGMTNSQTDGQSWEEAKAEIDQNLLKILAPLDLCYDVMIDSKFYRVRIPYVEMECCYC